MTLLSREEIAAGLPGHWGHEGDALVLDRTLADFDAAMAFAVAVADFFVVRRGRWDTSDSARFRWAPAAAWALGFVAYQLIYPGAVPVWSDVKVRWFTVTTNPSSISSAANDCESCASTTRMAMPHGPSTEWAISISRMFTCNVEAMAVMRAS
mgnify:CR=1 FL=1